MNSSYNSNCSGINLITKKEDQISKLDFIDGKFRFLIIINYLESKTDNEICSNATANFSLTKLDPHQMIKEEISSNNNDPVVLEHVHGVIDYRGGRLTCPESGVELIIPENAIPYGAQKELFVKVCNDNAQNPPLDLEKKEALMSPLVSSFSTFKV